MARAGRALAIICSFTPSAAQVTFARLVLPGCSGAGWAPMPGTGPVTERLRVSEIDDDMGRRLVPDRDFSFDGLSSLYPKYKGGPPPKFTLPQRREIKKIVRSRPAEHGLPFSAWSLSKLAEFPVAEGGRRHHSRGPAGPAPRGGNLQPGPGGNGPRSAAMAMAMAMAMIPGACRDPGCAPPARADRGERPGQRARRPGRGAGRDRVGARLRPAQCRGHAGHVQLATRRGGRADRPGGLERCRGGTPRVRGAIPAAGLPSADLALARCQGSLAAARGQRHSRAAT
jgi:hypothetical protein